MVRAQAELLESLGVRRLQAVIGSSIGGMQALQWAVDFPKRVETCIAVGAATLSAMGLALNHLQRQAIRNDPAWLDGAYETTRQPGCGSGSGSRDRHLFLQIDRAFRSALCPATRSQR